ncbi:MAG: hypothetical protein ACK4GL_02990 [Flavobacteriales bacterium]
MDFRLVNQVEIILVALVLLVSACKPNDIKVKETLAQQAKTLAEAVQNNDFELIADYAHPNLIYLFGGKESFLKAYKEDVLSDPHKILKVEFVSAESPIFVDNGYQSIVYFRTEATLNNELLESDQAMLAISDAKGKTWKFVQISGTFEELQEFVPEVSKKLFVE